MSDILTLRLAALLPQNWAVLIAIGLFLLTGCYLLLERAFRKVELVASLRRMDAMARSGK